MEYIFSRAIYNKVNGFQNFEMAWGSDIATWIKMGAEKGIKTLMVILFTGGKVIVTLLLI